MKVIIIKDCKDGKVNDIIEVSPGYGSNFLIKKGYAEPVNKSSNQKLNERLKNDQEVFNQKLKEAFELKKELEKLTLVFELKVTNLVIHGSITTKKINQKLKELGFNLEKYSVPHIQIESLGETNIIIKLFNKIEANIKVVVNKID